MKSDVTTRTWHGIHEESIFPSDLKEKLVDVEERPPGKTGRTPKQNQGRKYLGNKQQDQQ